MNLESNAYSETDDNEESDEESNEESDEENNKTLVIDLMVRAVFEDDFDDDVEVAEESGMMEVRDNVMRENLDLCILKMQT
ncbi:hypothetical protein HK098_006862 [Nowakowskiella sp. JEL0407]|nr:hypothetical protein HK098_006862 [Nowakowskiella sp. JEL0407]